MAINKLDNLASVTYKGTTLLSNTVETLLDLAPILLKVVDKLTASIGDTLTYTITITNPGLTAMTSLAFRDALPAGAVYVADSFKIDGAATVPTVTANVLTYTISSLAALQSTVVTFQATVTGE